MCLNVEIIIIMKVVNETYKADILVEGDYSAVNNKVELDGGGTLTYQLIVNRVSGSIKIYNVRVDNNPYQLDGDQFNELEDLAKVLLEGVDLSIRSRDIVCLDYEEFMLCEENYEVWERHVDEKVIVTTEGIYADYGAYDFVCGVVSHGIYYQVEGEYLPHHKAITSAQPGSTYVYAVQGGILEAVNNGTGWLDIVRAYFDEDFYYYQSLDLVTAYSLVADDVHAYYEANLAKSA